MNLFKSLQIQVQRCVNFYGVSRNSIYKINRCFSTKNPNEEINEIKDINDQKKIDGLSELESLKITLDKREKLEECNALMKTFKAGHGRPGSTHYRKPIHLHLHTGQPVKALTAPLKKTGGRNITGRITIRGRGGGHKRRARFVDFYRNEPGKSEILRIEYDPNRSAHIALIHNIETDRVSYVLATLGLRAGDVIESFRSGIPKDFLDEMEKTNNSVIDESLLFSRIIKKGNCLPLRLIPTGSLIHSIALNPDGKAKLMRSAGTFARLLSKNTETNKVVIKLSSGEHRYVHIDCIATLGVVSNKEHQLISWGKAGKSRQRGFRPKVRGVAMNCVDHPHGGGRGKSKSNKVSQSKWGVKKFAKTRTSKNYNKMKVKDRREK